MYLVVDFWRVCIVHLFNFRCFVFLLFIFGGFVLFIFLASGVVWFVFFFFVLCLVYPMLHVSLYCSFLIAPSVFSNVYFIERTEFTFLRFYLGFLITENKSRLNLQDNFISERGLCSACWLGHCQKTTFF